MQHEAGIDGVDVPQWYGLFAPAKTPSAVVDDVNGDGGDDDSVSEAERLERALVNLERLAAGVDTDAGRLMELEMAPYAGDPALREVMRPKLKDWMVQNTIFNDPMVRDAMGKWRQRRRPDAPPGARGTK